MYALNTSTMTIEGFTASSISVSNLHFVATIYDVRQEQKPDFSEYFRAPVLTTFTGVSTVTLIPAPGQNIFRKIERLQVYNADNVSHTVSMRYNNNNTTYFIAKQLMASTETFDLIKLRII